MAELLEIEGANAFRVRAYRNAARVVEEHAEPVASLVEGDGRRLQELPGIGADLAGKIEEIVRTGSLAALSEVRRKAPKGAVELMRVPGIGPSRARTLAGTLGIRSVAGLARAAKAGKIRALPGFGAASERKILAELGARTAGERRISRAVAAQYGESVLEYLRAFEGVTRADIAGSFRRGRETVGDLDILVECADGQAVSDRFVAFPEVREVLAHGATRASVVLRSGLQIDLRVLDAKSYGAGLYYFTGSKAHNIAVRRLGQKRGLKLNEYGVFRGTRQIAGAREQDVFRAVGLPWIPPELREDRGEIEAALHHGLPDLVTLDDVRGDLQMHSTDSDGRGSLEEMAETAEAMGYAYIAVTDHGPMMRMVRGLDDAGFRRQRKKIDRLNAKLRKLTVLAGAEVDIHPDGTLDLTDDTLAGLDIVFVALHARLDLAPEKQTERVLRALTHPHVDVFAHPTGRLINGRRGAQFDFDRVVKAAVDHGVMLEVDAQPERLDLDDTAVRSAIGLGATIVIDTDAHSPNELRFMRWGVDQARRGWAEKKNVANTRPLSRFLKLLHASR
ncbi:MAG: DNA polymerase/3'-5' exonuclease PolX [Gemmatimonadota bacterium]|nr:DNA polymerase/3'-5' exonuclease PolX [Gemmatimonadota bacterium]MDE3216104.1 DNA polymerase/3'-5' exonuclease PolX [Gemmatimonadota bacterium]